MVINSKKGHFIDLISDTFIVLCIFAIMILGTMIATIETDNNKEGVINPEVNLVTIDYNLLSLLRFEVEKDLTISDEIRTFCKSGDDSTIRKKFTDYLKFFAKKGDLIIIKTDDSFCKSSFELEYGVENIKTFFGKLTCSEARSNYAFVPNDNGEPIVIALSMSRCLSK